MGNKIWTAKRFRHSQSRCTQTAASDRLQLMSGPTQPRRRPLTVGALLDAAQGVNLHCKCGHRTALLPAQIAAMAHPDTRLLEFKRRFRCSMCGRTGASDDIRLDTFEATTPFVDVGDFARAKPPASSTH